MDSSAAAGAGVLSGPSARYLTSSVARDDSSGVELNSLRLWKSRLHLRRKQNGKVVPTDPAPCTISQRGPAQATLQSRAIPIHACSSAEDGQPQEAAGVSRAPTANTWQLDFCSRPILDERGKKVWELLICDETRSFEFSRYFPNNKINSTQVRRINAAPTCMHYLRVPLLCAACSRQTLV